MDSLIKVATCNLNQWAMDFDTNLRNIIRSIEIAKEKGARFRTGPELEICGYGCEDHFLEQDTFLHSWESLVHILRSDLTMDIVCDIGMPVLHRGVRYNCRVICLNRRILLIRPKSYLANDGNYREPRWFTAWKFDRPLEECTLPQHIFEVTGQRRVMIGVAILQFHDTAIAVESCEELFTPAAPHIAQGLGGAEIFANGSASHHTLRKLHKRMNLMRMASQKVGGIYMYANQQGCDGGRLYYDGCASVCVNGQCVVQASQFSLLDVEVVCAVVDLNDVRSFRAAVASRGPQAQESLVVPRVDVAFQLCLSSTSASWWTVLSRVPSTASTTNPPATESASPVTVSASLASFFPSMPSSTPAVMRLTAAASDADPNPLSPLLCENNNIFTHTFQPSTPQEVQYMTPEEEIAYGPACWLWDYLRRSGASGYFLPLSGGADSSAACVLVHHMCRLVVRACAEGNEQVLNDVRRICQHSVPAYTKKKAKKDDTTLYTPTDPKELCGRIFHTLYMGASASSDATRERAKNVALQAGSHHAAIDIDGIVQSVVSVFHTLTGRRPRFRAHGGSNTENLALQNIQARVRMVFSYVCAQLLPWVYSLGSSSGFLLVLGAANVDEALRGYMTKYDCSSADINPIGGLSKLDLRSFLVWAVDELGFTSLNSVLSAPPTAELEPTTDGYTQTDEDDMGMTYEELGLFGRLRKLLHCGPVSMYEKLKHTWSSSLSPSQVADKVKTFFRFYAINRHKMTTLTPAYHAEDYSPDDNRYDLRPFLYQVRWTRQFAVIDHLVNSDNVHYRRFLLTRNDNE